MIVQLWNLYLVIYFWNDIQSLFDVWPQKWFSFYSRIYNSYYEIPKNDMSSFHFKVNIQDKSCFNSHIKAYLQNEM